jgi:hypothetical protein
MSGSVFAQIPEQAGQAAQNVNPLAIATNIADYRSKVNALQMFTAQQQAGQAVQAATDPNTGAVDTQKLGVLLSKNPLTALTALDTEKGAIANADSGVGLTSDKLLLQQHYQTSSSNILSGLTGANMDGDTAREEYVERANALGIPPTQIATIANEIQSGPHADNDLISLARSEADAATQSNALALGKINGFADTNGALYPITQGPAGAPQAFGSPITKTIAPTLVDGKNAASQPVENLVQQTPNAVPQPFGTIGQPNSNVPVIPVGGIGGNNASVPAALAPPGYQGNGGQYNGQGVPSPQQVANMGNGQAPQPVIPNAPPQATLPGGSVVVSPTGIVTDLSPSQTKMGAQIEGQVEAVQQANNGYAQRDALLQSTGNNIRTAGTGPLAESVVQPVRGMLSEMLGLDKDAAAAFDEAHKGTNAIAASDIQGGNYSTDFYKQIVTGMNANMSNTTQGNLYVLAGAKGLNDTNNLVSNVLSNVGLPGQPGGSAGQSVMTNAGQMDGNGNYLYNRIQNEVLPNLNPMVPAFQAMDPANRKAFLSEMDPAEKERFSFQYNYYHMIQTHDSTSPFGRANYPAVLKEYGQNGWNGSGQ